MAKIIEKFPFVICHDCKKCVMNVSKAGCDTVVSCRNTQKCVDEIKYARSDDDAGR